MNKGRKNGVKVERYEFSGVRTGQDNRSAKRVFLVNVGDKEEEGSGVLGHYLVVSCEGTIS